MRVAFDGRSLSGPVLRGWDRYAVGLVRGLVGLGVEVTLFHRARRPLHAPHVEGLGCRVLGLRDLSGLHYEQVVVPRAIGRLGFDLFHAPFEHGVPLASPRPVALTIHSVTEASYLDLIHRGMLTGGPVDYLGYQPRPRSWLSLYGRWQVDRADHVFTPSEFCRGEVIRFLGVSPDRVTTTPLAVHEQFRRVERGESDRVEALRRLGVPPGPYLLYVGGYEPHKNVEGLLDAFALIREARPDLTLVLVGSKGLPKDVIQHAEGLGLRAGREVVFLVNLADELTDLYDGADMLVTLSWRETFCLPALEALTRGIPVVASSWGATPEVVGDAGRLVDPRDPRAARDAVLELLADENRPMFRDRAREQASHYSWARTAERTIEVYESMLRRH